MIKKLIDRMKNMYNNRNEWKETGYYHLSSLLLTDDWLQPENRWIFQFV